MADLEARPTIDVKAAVGEWSYPWPNVAELARVLPSDRWTLIGGLMTQLHAIHHGIDAVRPTNDVDIVLHIETARGTPNATAAALESLGYEMKENVDPRNNVGHRFTRGDTHVDVVSSDDADVIDVVVADHAAPSVDERMRWHPGEPRVFGASNGRGDCEVGEDPPDSILARVLEDEVGEGAAGVHVLVLETVVACRGRGSGADVPGVPLPGQRPLSDEGEHVHPQDFATNCWSGVKGRTGCSERCKGDCCVEHVVGMLCLCPPHPGPPCWVE